MDLPYLSVAIQTILAIIMCYTATVCPRWHINTSYFNPSTTFLIPPPIEKLFFSIGRWGVCTTRGILCTLLALHTSVYYYPMKVPPPPPQQKKFCMEPCAWQCKIDQYQYITISFTDGTKQVSLGRVEAMQGTILADMTRVCYMYCHWTSNKQPLRSHDHGYLIQWQTYQRPCTQSSKVDTHFCRLVVQRQRQIDGVRQNSQFILCMLILDIPEDAHHGVLKRVKPTYVRTQGLKRGRALLEGGLLGERLSVCNDTIPSAVIV